MIAKDLPSLGVTVVAVPGDYAVDYTVYERFDCAASDAAAPESAPYLSGSVKWDGCSNWSFDEMQRCCFHFCGRDKIKNISAVMEACWDWTSELLPTWRKDIAE